MADWQWAVWLWWTRMFRPSPVRLPCEDCGRAVSESRMVVFVDYDDVPIRQVCRRCYRRAA
jgi:hypothetical protein